MGGCPAALGGSGAGHLGEGAPHNPSWAQLCRCHRAPFVTGVPAHSRLSPLLQERLKPRSILPAPPHPLFTSTPTTLGYGTATAPAPPWAPPAPTRAEPKRGAGGAGAVPIIPSPTAPLSTGTQQQLSPAVPGSIRAEPSQRDPRHCPRPPPRAPRGRAGAFWGAGSLWWPPPACRS